MKKAFLISIFILQFMNCSSIQSQTEKSRCSYPHDLNELKKELTPLVNQFERELNNKKARFFDPNTTLYFEENCEFPNEIEPIALYISYLTTNKKSNIKIVTSSDSIEYIKNPKIAIKRANKIKKTIVFYGINDERISIQNLKDKYPVASNKTELGRKQNRNIIIKIEE